VSNSVIIPALPEAPPELPSASIGRHLAAASLSTLLPGAGQLFLGRRKSAALLFGGLVAISVGFFVLRLPRTYPGLAFLGWMCLLLCLWSVFGALLARDTSGARVSRWWVFAGLLLHYLSVNLIFTVLLFGSGFRTVKNASSSMEPTLALGEKFVVDQHYYRDHPVNRGDLIIFRRQNSSWIKRVVAIPGDTIEGKERVIVLNGEVKDEPFVLHKSRPGENSDLDTFGPVSVPPGSYFVMGDNRDVSLDSRTAEFGLVDSTSIVGRPIYGYHIIDKPLWWKLN